MKWWTKRWMLDAVVQRCSVKKVFFRNFAKFTGKQLCQILLFNNVASLRSATLLKKRLWYRCFPVNFVNFLRTFFIEHLWWLLLECQLSFLSSKSAKSLNGTKCRKALVHNFCNNESFKNNSPTERNHNIKYTQYHHFTSLKI